MMKNFKYNVYILILCLYSQNFTLEKKYSSQDLINLENRSKKRINIAIGIIAILGYYNVEKILNYYKEHTLLSVLVSYPIGIMITDTYTKYKTLYQNVSLLKSIDKIYRYIQSALFIEPDQQKCFEYIQKYSNFSIAKIEEITQAKLLETLQCINCSSLHEIQYECPNIHQPNCRPISLEEIISQVQDDKDLYYLLLCFKKNTLLDKDVFFQKIGQKIHDEIKLLIEK